MATKFPIDNSNVITGEIYRVKTLVSTGQSHGLLNNEYVEMDVSPGINTTFVVKYNDYNRRVIVTPKSFVSYLKNGIK